MNDVERRDFLEIAGWSGLAAGAALSTWPLVHSLGPSADVQALSTVRIDLAPIAPGMAVTVMWRGKPVWIRHQTPEDITRATAVDPSRYRDPETYAARVQRPEWLVQIGVCTHLGCIPLGQKPGETKGDYGGYFCACHGSHYDSAGRIRKGPAPRNLEIPPHRFEDDTTLIIG
ncbi:MAG: ubiquinol-cytochrome c reductase iron-sulfur subunit [Pseudomonadota bacterium]